LGPRKITYWYGVWTILRSFSKEANISSKLNPFPMSFSPAQTTTHVRSVVLVLVLSSDAEVASAPSRISAQKGRISANVEPLCPLSPHGPTPLSGRRSLGHLAISESPTSDIEMAEAPTLLIFFFIFVLHDKKIKRIVIFLFLVVSSFLKRNKRNDTKTD
jgi:hypothetical protein